MAKPDLTPEQRRRIKNKCSAKRSRDARKLEFQSMQAALESAKQDLGTMFQHTQMLMDANAAQSQMIEDLRRQLSLVSATIIVPMNTPAPSPHGWEDVLLKSE